jgi:hypothetical protein
VTERPQAGDNNGPPLDRPEHSGRGASSAHRWFNCPGSVALSAGLPNNSSSFASEGTAAHELCATHLTNGSDAWESVGQKIEADGVDFEVTDEMAECAQLYLSTIREDCTDQGVYQIWVERGFHMNDIDPDLYGTADCVLYTRKDQTLRVYDFKYGVGIGVDAEANDQLLYYAAGAVHSLGEDLSTVHTIELIIVQPRHDHPDGLVRRWALTFDELGEWVEATLKPKLAASRAPDAPLVPGSWCQFCPAKQNGVCPALNATFDEAAGLNPSDTPGLEDWELGARLALVGPMKTLVKSLEDEAYARLTKGGDVPGFKLVRKKGNRVWKEGAADIASIEFGDDAYKSDLKSPAQIERLKGGKAVTKEWAFAPDKGLTLAGEDDKREGVTAAPPGEAYADI